MHFVWSIFALCGVLLHFAKLPEAKILSWETADDSLSKLHISLKHSHIIRRIPLEFLSLGLDSLVLHRHLCGLNFRYMCRIPVQKLRQNIAAVPLAKALAPGYLRVGGTTADQYIFDPNARDDRTQQNDDQDKACGLDFMRFGQRKARPNITLTPAEVDQIYEFASASGLRLVLDLNILLRDRNTGSFNTTNAKLLLDYVDSQNYDLDFELGNEPEMYRRSFNITITPEQAAKDFALFRDLLKTYPRYKQSLLLGPSVTGVSKRNDYLKTFLQAAGSEAATAISFHQYYVNGLTATVDQFMEPKILDKLISQVKMAVDWVRSYARPHAKPIWIGETSSAVHGGAAGISDRYVAGFMWLDKLGLSAQLGMDVIIRFTFFHGRYSMLDDNSYPNPDFWLSLVYKLTVGEDVLSLNTSFSEPSHESFQRFYAHCALKKPGKAVIYGMNLLKHAITVHVDKEMAPSGTVKQYLLEPKDGDLTSKSVLLNGIPLHYDGAGVPKLQPTEVKTPVKVPGRRFIFLEVDSLLCK